MRRYTILIILALFGTLLSSMIPCQGQPIWYAQYLGLLFFLHLGISLTIWKFSKVLSLFSLVSLFSAFFITVLSPRAIVLLFQINMSLLACYGISKLDEKNRRIIIWGIFGLVVLQIAWLTLQCFNLDPIFKSIIRPGKNEMVGFNGAKDQIGTFFAITLPVVIKCCPILILISLLAIFFSHSSFAFISAIISGLVYLYFTKNKYFKAFLISVIVASILFFTFGEKIARADCNARFNAWRYSIKSTVKGSIDIEKNGNRLQIRANPVCGYGLGNFLRIFPYVKVQDGFNYENEIFDHAHNDYVEFFFEFGWIGFLLLTVFAFVFGFSFFASIKTPETVLYFSSLIAYFLNASGNFLSHLGCSGLFLIILYGFYRGALNDEG